MIKLSVLFQKAEASVSVLTSVALVSLQKAVAAITFGHFLIFKELLDSASSSDAVTKQINKTTTDTSSVVDTTNVNVTKPLSNALSLSDSAFLSFTATKSEVAAFTDVQTFATAKILSNEASIADTAIRFVFVRPFNETLVVANQASVNFVKSLSNLSLVADALTTTTTKNLTNSFSASDSGSLRGQGYCDFGYFSDDFVGYSQTI